MIYFKTERAQRFHVISWENMRAKDIGNPFVMESQTPRSVMVYGEFGYDGKVFIEGSNHPKEKADPVFCLLNDTQNNALSINNKKIEQILESCLQVRPVIINGNDETSINVILLVEAV